LQHDVTSQQGKGQAAPHDRFDGVGPKILLAGEAAYTLIEQMRSFQLGCGCI
jgi:hypothetical protein